MYRCWPLLISASVHFVFLFSSFFFSLNPIHISFPRFSSTAKRLVGRLVSLLESLFSSSLPLANPRILSVIPLARTEYSLASLHIVCRQMPSGSVAFSAPPTNWDFALWPLYCPWRRLRTVWSNLIPRNFALLNIRRFSHRRSVALTVGSLRASNKRPPFLV